MLQHIAWLRRKAALWRAACRACTLWHTRRHVWKRALQRRDALGPAVIAATAAADTAAARASAVLRVQMPTSRVHLGAMRAAKRRLAAWWSRFVTRPTVRCDPLLRHWQRWRKWLRRRWRQQRAVCRMRVPRSVSAVITAVFVAGSTATAARAAAGAAAEKVGNEHCSGNEECNNHDHNHSDHCRGLIAVTTAIRLCASAGTVG